MDFFSFKDLESVRLKATSNMRIGNREFLEKETVIYFDSLEIFNSQEVSNFVSAKGGYGNRSHVFWETVKELDFVFQKGVFNKEQFALMNNSNMIEKVNNTVALTNREILESDEDGYITCKFMPIDTIFIYNKETYEKMVFDRDGKTLHIDRPFTEVIIDYNFFYEGSSTEFSFGQNLYNGFFELEGRTRLKDDKTGQVTTGILKIPKIKLVSDLSIRLGEKASPMMGKFNGIALPVGSRSNSYVSEFYMLSDDIESDL